MIEPASLMQPPFRIRMTFRLPPGYSFDLENVIAFQNRNLTVNVTRANDSYAVIIDGFESETQAREYVPTIFVTMYKLMLELDTPIYFSTKIGEIGYSSDPELARVSLNKNFDMSLEDAVDGMAAGDEIFIYPSHARIQFLTFGKVTVGRSYNINKVFNGFLANFPSDVMEHSDIPSELRRATELYANSFLEGFIETRFLTLIRAIEVLSVGNKPNRSLHPEVQKIIDQLKEDIKTKQESLRQDASAKRALDQLDSWVGNLNQVSIKERIEALVENKLGQGAYAGVIEKLYHVRNILVHGGPGNEDISQYVSQAQKLVSDLLKVEYNALSPTNGFSSTR